ncbi:HNH endonuclease [Streptomyces sp. NPDC055912]|uniref:HNH endonuclease n=1 Tax=Streptomyces sp. NPDC055912 TaxID=3345660 RepID=UPI0035E1ED6A
MMRPIAKPDLDARTVFDTCTAGASPKTVRTSLQALKDTVANAATEYDAAATARALHTFGKFKDQPDGVPKKTGGINKQLKNTYTSRMVHKRSAGRTFYDQLLKEAPDGRCALCGQGIADTLDHQLPKTHYPLLAVAPANLVPACRDCNYYKGEEAPTSAEKQTLHPYYDSEVHDHTWLVARVAGPPKPSLVFHAAPPPEMAPLLAARVRHHFTTLKLARLYNPQAGPELRNLSRSLPRLPANMIPEHLRERAEDWAASEGVNSWQAALYRGLAGSPWYTGGGYEEPWK